MTSNLILANGNFDGINVTREGHWWRESAVLMPPGNWLRFPLKHGEDRYSLCQELRGKGYRILAVFDSATFEDGTFEQVSNDLLNYYAGQIDAVQAGNEWDSEDPDSDSSWKLSAERLSDLLWAVRGSIDRYAAYNNAPLILGGAVSGQAARLKPVLDLVMATCNVIAIHPYGQRYHRSIPAPAGDYGYVGDLIKSYRDISPLPVVVTEYGESSDTVGEDRQAAYVKGMQMTLAILKVPLRLVFCGHPYLGFGMWRPDGSSKPVMAAYTSALGTFVVPPTPAPEKPTVYEYKSGFLTLATKLGAKIVGTPLENEHMTKIDGHDIAHQLTSMGEMRWYQHWDDCRFIPALH